MRPTRFSICIVVLMSLANGLVALPPITVRSSHSSQIHDMIYDTDEQLLFTAGEDGKLLVWDTRRERLIQNIRIDQIPLRKIVLYPDSERIAVYSSDGQRHRITVWNWRDGTRSFLHTPEDAVLWMVPSPQGSYIMYSLPSLRSVRVIDADSGRSLPFLRQNTGIVTWMVVADSEERVMTYAPATGEIAYRTVTNGRIAGSFNGPRNLSMLTLLSTRRFAAARSGTGRLVVVDLLSGDQVAETEAGDIESLQTDFGNGDIVAVIRGDRNRTVRRYRFAEGTIQQRYTTRRELSPSVVSQTYADDTLFAGTRNGEILRWPPFASRSISFAQNQISPVSDLYAVENRLHMLTSDRVISIASDFFDAQARDEGETSYVSHGETPVAAGGQSRFIVADDDLLLWTPQSRDGRIKRYRIDSSELTPLDWTIDSGLLSIHAYQDEILSLTRGGTVELHRIASGERIFSYRGRGLQTAIRTSRGIFVGNARQDSLDSAILRLNPQTQETVPLETESRLVFSLAFDERRGRLFAIGVRDGRSGSPSTVIEVFEGFNLSRRRTILEVPGEYPRAELILDPVTGAAYTTLDDRGGILQWDGRRVTELFRNRAHIPRRIFLQGTFLYTLNQDGTVSVIDRREGSRILDLYVMENGAWLALREDGRFFASTDEIATTQYLSVNADATLLRDYRLVSESNRPAPQEQRAPTIDRLQSGDDGDLHEESRTFDPLSGEPAPSS